MQATTRLSPTIGTAVRNAFVTALQKAFPTIPDVDPAIGVANPRFGDYQCNCAMMLFKEHRALLGKPQTPRDVAETIKENLDCSMFSEATVAPQGFISVRLSPATLQNFFKEHGTRDSLLAKNGTTCKVLVDYSSPNIAKEMHVGHLRSTIIGEVICRVLEFADMKVMRVNHLGDWGTQFGMLIEHLREAYPNFLENAPDLKDLTSFYREAKKRFDEDADFKKRAQLMVPKLQSGDAEARAAWSLFCAISRKDFQRLYDRFGVSLIERGESFYNDLIPQVVKDFDDAGLVTDSDGAKTIFVKDDPVPLIVVKADGGYGYDSTDLACIYHRLKVENHQWVIYVTDIGQETHFHKIFKAAEAKGWHVPGQTKLSHVGFGLVQGVDGKKFKTRSGDVVKLTDLLDEAVERAMKELTTRRNAAEEAAESGATDASPTGPTDLEKSAEVIGLAAIRYFDLKQNRLTNYKFSFDKMLDAKGNTAVYLLYAYARICAVFRKAGIRPEDIPADCLDVSEPSERQLLLHILKFYDVVNQCVDDLHVHRIAEYMYELAGLFTTFYQNCKVVGTPQEKSRLLLCEYTRQFLAMCFALFGIEPLDRI